MFVPLKHPPGHAQVNLGEADIYVNGVLERAHFFVMDLPHSDEAFVMAFPAETTEAFCEWHNQALAYFSGCRKRFYTTTPRSPWPRSWGMGRDSDASL